MADKKRDYKKEYQNYQGKPDQIKKRASRNAARRKMEADGKVKKGDGKDVDHQNGNPKDNSKSNLKAKPKSKNRSFPRKADGSKKNKTD
jgi:hypothetical protein